MACHGCEKATPEEALAEMQAASGGGETAAPSAEQLALRAFGRRLSCCRRCSGTRAPAIPICPACGMDATPLARAGKLIDGCRSPEGWAA